MVKNNLKLPLNKEEIDKLIEQYHSADGHSYPDWMAINKDDNEVRYDYDSSNICYSLIRHFKPTNCLEFGTSFGHSTLFILDALIKNELPFHFQGWEMLGDLYNKTKENIIHKFREMPKGMELVLGNITQEKDLSGKIVPVPDNLDFVFIDTNHEIESTEWYVKNVFPKIVPGGLVAIHDFHITEGEDGKWLTKGDLGQGGTLAETLHLRDLFNAGLLPLQKIYFMYQYRDQYPSPWEGSFWIKK